MLENELISLIPSIYYTLQDFFTKFKYLFLQLKKCGIDKDGDQLILMIISNMGPEYSTFISTFHTSRLTMGKTWKIPPLDAFI
jgi:hypothetical protein